MKLLENKVSNHGNNLEKDLSILVDYKEEKKGWITKYFANLKIEIIFPEFEGYIRNFENRWEVTSEKKSVILIILI